MWVLVGGRHAAVRTQDYFPAHALNKLPTTSFHPSTPYSPRGILINNSTRLEPIKSELRGGQCTWREPSMCFLWWRGLQYIFAPRKACIYQFPRNPKKQANGVTPQDLNGLHGRCGCDALSSTPCTWADSSPKLAELKGFKVTAVMCARVFGILIRALNYCVGELPGPIHYSGECERYLLPRLLSLWDEGKSEEDEKMKIEKQREN